MPSTTSAGESCPNTCVHDRYGPRESFLRPQPARPTASESATCFPPPMSLFALPEKRPELSVVDDARGFAALRQEWTDLLADSESDSLFLTWEWLHTWWTHFAGSRRLFIVTMR